MAVLTFVYAFTRGRCQLSEGYTCPPQSTLARHSATPLDAARWAGEQQHRQYHQRGGDERDHERAEEAHSAVDAAKTGENAEHDIDGGFHHGVDLVGQQPRFCGWNHSSIGRHQPTSVMRRQIMRRDATSARRRSNVWFANPTFPFAP